MHRGDGFARSAGREGAKRSADGADFAVSGVV